MWRPTTRATEPARGLPFPSRHRRDSADTKGRQPNAPASDARSSPGVTNPLLALRTGWTMQGARERAARSGSGMTDTPQDAGWWVASDGRWYPPEQHPDYPLNVGPAPPGSAAPTPEIAGLSAPSYPPLPHVESPGPKPWWKRWWTISLGSIVALLVVLGVIGAIVGDDNETDRSRSGALSVVALGQLLEDAYDSGEDGRFDDAVVSLTELIESEPDDTDILAKAYVSRSRRPCGAGSVRRGHRRRNRRHRPRTRQRHPRPGVRQPVRRPWESGSVRRGPG